MNQQIAEPGLLIGMDWADQKHDIYVIDRHGKGIHRVLSATVKNLRGGQTASRVLLKCGGPGVAVPGSESANGQAGSRRGEDSCLADCWSRAKR